MRRALLIALAWCALSCSDRQRLNPLDPQAELGASGIGQLAVMAGDGQVDLDWDYSQFDDIEGYVLYKRQVGGEFAPGEFVPLTREMLPAERRQYVDEAVLNGLTYEYRLGLVIAAEGERSVGEVERVTPGPEVAWVADRGNGLVWKINADARSARFARGRFFDLRDIHRSILCLRRETVNTAIFSERQVEVPDAARPAGGIRLPRTAGSVIASLSVTCLPSALCGPLWFSVPSVVEQNCRLSNA